MLENTDAPHLLKRLNIGKRQNRHRSIGTGVKAQIRIQKLRIGSDRGVLISMELTSRQNLNQ